MHVKPGPGGGFGACDRRTALSMIVQRGICLKFSSRADAGGDHMRLLHKRTRILFAAGFLRTTVVGLLIQSGRMSAGVDRKTADKPARSARGVRHYQNQLTPLANPAPLLGDYPEFVQPIVESRRFEAPLLVDDEGADLEVRAWRFSYNARGIIEMPNRLRLEETAVIMVHPGGIDDGQGWRPPEPAGVADFCTEEKNHLAGRHTREVIDPLLKRLRGRAAFIMYSIIGAKDPIRSKMYRTFDYRPTTAERAAAERELKQTLKGFEYTGEPLPSELTLSADKPVIDYFR